jgi:hypothetical protein
MNSLAFDEGRLGKRESGRSAMINDPVIALTDAELDEPDKAPIKAIFYSLERVLNFRY